jgi:LacI family transcriptional regulator
MAATDTTGRLSAEEVCASLDHHVETAAYAAERTGQTIAFVFNSPAVADPLHTFFGPLVTAARRRAEATGCDIVLCAPGDDEIGVITEEVVERAVGHGAQGLVVFGGEDGNPDVFRNRWPDLPAVFIEFDAVGPRSGNVAVDNMSAFEEIVLHLADTCHRTRIATITGLLYTRVAAERLDAYRTLIQRFGYQIRPDYIEAGDYQYRSAYESTKRLMALDDPPDAIACCCDVQAVGALLALEELGIRCPEDVSVTGFDDAEWASRVTPSLTTVRQPVAAMGVQAVESLFAMVDDPALRPSSMLLAAELVVRESCGALGR